MEQSIKKTKNKTARTFAIIVLIISAIMVTVYYIGTGENTPLY